MESGAGDFSRPCLVVGRKMRLAATLPLHFCSEPDCGGNKSAMCIYYEINYGKRREFFHIDEPEWGAMRN